MSDTTVPANDAALPDDKTTEAKTGDVVAQREDLCFRAFFLAYARWLKAKSDVAHANCGVSAETMAEVMDEEGSALRAFLATPAATKFQVWNRIEVFEDILSEELRTGRRRYSPIMTALGAIKADLINLDICD